MLNVLSRRGLISLALAATGASASGVRVKDVLSAADPMPMPPAHPYPVSSGIAAGTAPEDDWWTPLQPLRRALHTEAERYTQGLHMPAHIVGKRSWSPAYKEGVAIRDRTRLFRALEQLDNETTGKKILSAIMGKQ